MKRKEFAELVAKFEKFMNDNEMKKSKATKKAVEEVKEREQMVFTALI